MARCFAADIFGIDTRATAEWLALVGDSPNDVFIFSYFPCSVGLANVVKFRGRLDAKPTLVT